MGDPTVRDDLHAQSWHSTRTHQTQRSNEMNCWKHAHCTLASQTWTCSPITAKVWAVSGELGMQVRHASRPPQNSRRYRNSRDPSCCGAPAGSRSPWPMAGYCTSHPHAAIWNIGPLAHAPSIPNIDGALSRSTRHCITHAYRTTTTGSE
jgi:hypothetical protein